MKNAVIAGATGLIGKSLVSLILESKDVQKVSVVTRKPLGIESRKLSEHVDGFAVESRSGWISECDGADVFCALGTTLKKAGSVEAFRKVDHDLVLEFAAAAKEAGARSFFLVSSMGANSGALVPYARAKGEVEEALKKMGFSRLVIMRPSILLGEREEFRLGERIANALAAPLSGLFKGGLEKYKPIQASDVALAMLKLASHYEKGLRIVESDEIAEIASA